MSVDKLGCLLRILLSPFNVYSKAQLPVLSSDDVSDFSSMSVPPRDVVKYVFVFVFVFANTHKLIFVFVFVSENFKIAYLYLYLYLSLVFAVFASNTVKYNILI